MFAMPFSVVVGAGLVRFAPSGACVAAGHSALQDGPPVLIDAILRRVRSVWRRRRGGLAKAGGRYARVAVFFSKMAVVTLGAYAVLGGSPCACCS